ncbi:MAG: zeta toxin family protein [Acidobacteria bacterium]|nr:zeta toxin family protein [Acidobacteriota bacterium]
MPNVVVIAGPNGAGKSTLAPALLRDTFSVLEFVNADTIATGLSAFAPEDASLDASRVMLKRLGDLVKERRDFAFETTLAARSYAGWLTELQAKGYEVSLIFLWLETVEIAIQRVAARVRAGGHSIPEATIRRRFDRGLANFFELYLPVVDAWRVFHASPIIPKEVARYDRANGETIFDGALWKKIRK